MTIFAAWACIFSPLVGAAVTPLLARVSTKARDLAAVGFSFVAAVAALRLLPELFDPETLPLEEQHRLAREPDPDRIRCPDRSVEYRPRQRRCGGELHHHGLLPGLYAGRPCANPVLDLMNGFIGSMLLLVLSNNLLFLFLGWKLVGVCSYGLIGYYYQDQQKYWNWWSAPPPPL